MNYDDFFFKSNIFHKRISNFYKISLIPIIFLLDANVSDTKAVPKPSIELTKDTDEKIRRDSILFEEVSQGLVKLDSNGSKVEDKCKL